MATTAAVIIELGTEEIMNVLFLEHDDTYRESISRLLRGCGCNVEAVATPREAAALLEPNKFQLVIADVVFAPPDVHGDEFLVSNKDILESAKMIALTGQREYIAYENEFKDMDVAVIDKGDESEELERIVNGIIENRTETARKEMARAKETIISGRGVLAENNAREKLNMVKQVKARLLRELRNLPDPEEEIIEYKGKTYSVADLIREINLETNVGLEHMRMMFNLEASQNVGREDQEGL